jgi:tetratricopeptide (TPR) repeat protein
MLFGMRINLTALFLASVFVSMPFSAAAQDMPAPEPLPVPQVQPDSLTIERAPDEANEDAEPADVAGEDIVPEDLAPDYSKLSPKAERAARLDDLFVKLAEREDEESANLVAEEIMAIWTESGSASVNLLLRRGSEASAKGDPKLARKMYNHAVDLAPDYSEAWARSARLALTQKQYNRALNESLKTLALEPRHFYSLWTMGNVFEVLNRPEDALEAYREANRIYPELKAVKDRLGELETEVEGTVL